MGNGSFSETIKKFFVSGSVILGFLLYGFYQKINKATGSINISSTLPPAQTSASLGNGFQGLTTTPTVTPAMPSPSLSAPTPTSTPTPVSSSQKALGSAYKDGTYVGDSVYVYYGNVQVKVVIQSGKISDVQFLDYPHDRNTSIEINSQATPYLRSEALQAQSANVDIVSGATDTSMGFIKSLQSALAQAG